MEVTITYAKNNLSRLIARSALGEEITIVKGGKPIARVLPVGDSPWKVMLGSAKGEFVVPDDFNDPLPKEIEDLFYGE